MHILQGTWVLDEATDFVQHGKFYLWVETLERIKSRKKDASLHPHHLLEKALATFLTEHLGMSVAPKSIAPIFFLLPSTKEPCSSPELARYLEVDLPETWDWRYWIVQSCCCPISQLIKLLNEWHFLALHNLIDVQIGSDLLFWYHYTQFFKHVFLNDRYILALKYQATDRAFRIGQKKNVFVHKFVALGTLEERIDRRIEDKKKLASSIVGSDEFWLSELNTQINDRTI